MKDLGYGIMFGFVLSRAGATDIDAILNMFLFTDLHLAGVMAIGIITAGLGIALVRHYRIYFPDVPALVPKKFRPGLITGSLLFGVGWGMTGSCPGTTLSQIGEGRLMGLATLLGMLIGTFIFLFWGGRFEAWLIGMRRVPNSTHQNRAD